MSEAHNPARPCRVVVLISGNGSNLQALLDAQANSHYRIVAVISNRPEAFGLQRAAAAGVAAQVVDHKSFDSRESFDAALIQLIDQCKPDLLVLAGFMRILSSGFVQHYQGRLLNIHPSLLPAYKGTQTHKRVLEAGERQHGVSVHFVTEELDGGPVVRQAVIQIGAEDSVESLQQRVAVEEHRIYPQVVAWFAAGRLRLTAQGPELDGEILPPQGVRDPIS
ncbi:phosphoribosylglycinamide formyltransferase [Pseudohongiella spirulinae]|uniref:Phosphoribosylglycinamide formyltransferase n=1 Tax=Pseudohongiella spirulinae TaxID=1249552 RepID=A0A0S2KF96_9GAMM|nr:phosphoribosylglycinamide formyltransferase [Pseudohongiella spirulinae]ALO46639.1 phosphoribosylglycinamide formyltransferase [Pseudohongiella spirulinae]